MNFRNNTIFLSWALVFVLIAICIEGAVAWFQIICDCGRPKTRKKRYEDTFEFLSFLPSTLSLCMLYMHLLNEYYDVTGSFGALYSLQLCRNYWVSQLLQELAAAVFADAAARPVPTCRHQLAPGQCSRDGLPRSLLGRRALGRRVSRVLEPCVRILWKGNPIFLNPNNVWCNWIT